MTLVKNRVKTDWNRTVESPAEIHYVVYNAINTITLEQGELKKQV
jgi:hypothetical protein